MKKIHFMGIGGSGANAVASIAHSLGYDVSGCDLSESSYTYDLKNNGVPIFEGHDVSHLDSCDILCISPALLSVSPIPMELQEARERNIVVMTWQQFMGKYLHEGKKVITIAGTKGKTTTTAMVGQLLETAGLDPVVQVGGKVVAWHKNYRLGSSEYFVSEADEFNNNFLSYHSNIAIITNIEMDHPEFFRSEDDYFQAFVNFAKLLPKDGLLIVNADSPGVQIFLNLLGDISFRVIRYGVSSDVTSDSMVISSYRVDNGKTVLIVDGLNDEKLTFYTDMVGLHNVSNICAVICLSKVLGIPSEVIQSALNAFRGTERRFELICDVKGIKVYNDYAHNPMSVKAVLESTRSKYPDSRIWAIFQPHMYTRTKMFLNEYAMAFDSANEVVVTEIFASREKGLPVSKEINNQIVVNAIKKVNPKINVRAIDDKIDVADMLLSELKSGDVVVNMGAGDNGIIVELLKSKL